MKKMNYKLRIGDPDDERNNRKKVPNPFYMGFCPVIECFHSPRGNENYGKISEPSVKKESKLKWTGKGHMVKKVKRIVNK